MKATPFGSLIHKSLARNARLDNGRPTRIYELAETVGVSRQLFYLAAYGKTGLGDEVVEALAEALEVTPATIRRRVRESAAGSDMLS